MWSDLQFSLGIGLYFKYLGKVDQGSELSAIRCLTSSVICSCCFFKKKIFFLIFCLKARFLSSLFVVPVFLIINNQHWWGRGNTTRDYNATIHKTPQFSFFWWMAQSWNTETSRASGSWREKHSAPKVQPKQKMGASPLWCGIKAPAAQIALVIEEETWPATEQETRLVVDSAGPRFLFIANAIWPPLLRCINGNSWSWGSACTEATCIHLLNLMSAGDQQVIESQVEG